MAWWLEPEHRRLRQRLHTHLQQYQPAELDVGDGDGSQRQCLAGLQRRRRRGQRRHHQECQRQQPADADQPPTYQLSGTLAYSEHDSGSYANGNYAWSGVSYTQTASSVQTTQEARTSTSSQSGTQSGTTNPGGSSLGLS